MVKAKVAGIEVLVAIIFGIGGRGHSKEHIAETARLLNLINPEQ